MNFLKGNCRFSRVFLLGVATMIVTVPSAFAVTTLKKVQITDDSQIDLIFDGKVAPGQIKTEFFNDTIQLSLNDVSVYPAKISSVSGMDLTKVFAYQYSPKLVRCRLSVKGKAEDYQKRFVLKTSGKVVTVRILDNVGGEKSDKIVQSAASANRAGEPMDVEEKALLERVLKNDPKPEAKEAKDSKAEKNEKADKGDKADKADKSDKVAQWGTQSKPIGGAKPLPSPVRSMVVLAILLGLFGVIMLAVRKIRSEHSIKNHKGLSGLLGKIGGTLGKSKFIEVVATHHLGPKKSIAIVKVSGRMLVLGVTHESINLISEFQANEAEEDYGLSQANIAGGVGSFASALSNAETTNLFASRAPSQSKAQPAAQSSARSQLNAQLNAQMNTQPNAHSPSFSRSGVGAYSAPRQSYAEMDGAPALAALAKEPTKSSVRAQIKNRLEGMKPL